MRFLWAGVLAMLLVAWPAVASAHKASDAFLDLRGEGKAVVVRWDIALRDLDQVLDLDLNRDGTLEWREIEAQQAAIEDHALGALQLTTKAGACRPAAVSQQLARREDGAYAVLRWRAECPQPPAEIDIEYRLMANIDPTHQAIVSVSGAEVQLRTLRPTGQAQTVSLRPREAGTARYDLAGFFVEGFRHILYGFDHLAFLLALLIPALSLASVNQRRLGATLGELLTIVSVFTLAHSLTLALTALNLISLPSRLVEIVIALSVIVAGLQAFWWEGLRRSRSGFKTVPRVSGSALSRCGWSSPSGSCTGWGSGARSVTPASKVALRWRRSSASTWGSRQGNWRSWPSCSRLPGHSSRQRGSGGSSCPGQPWPSCSRVPCGSWLARSIWTSFPALLLASNFFAGFGQRRFSGAHRGAVGRASGDVSPEYFRQSASNLGSPS
jgi:hypothetical protein